ncbi:carbohydrate sulfotransferase 11 [Aplysia californica]|uniref:Carbohydrate sulfotransferase n=1 Tax=Aplysia californica TaxID=6500 RepID=A0ABM1VUN6_APLCA|nr:carbohydrate sulfotransferase 11 [Aplysia californica]
MKASVSIGSAPYLPNPHKLVAMRLGSRLLILVVALGVVVPIVVLFSSLDTGLGKIRGTQPSNTAATRGAMQESTVQDPQGRAGSSRLISPMWWTNHIHSTCERLGYQKPRVEEIKPEMFKKILVDDDNKLLYCQIPKVASTTWRRVFLLLSGKMNTTNPLELRSNDVHHKYDEFLTYLSDFSTSDIMYRLNHYFKFVFVREPFERLLSAFRNKFETNTLSAAYFRKQFGRKIIEKYRENPTKEAVELGTDLKFEEFVNYLTDPKRKLHLNEHWDKFQDLCHPCIVNYDFIGKLPNIDKDSGYVLERTGIADKVKFPSRSESKYGRLGTDSYMKKYYTQIPKKSLIQLFNMYKADFAIFNFTIPEVIKEML